MVEHKLF